MRCVTYKWIPPSLSLILTLVETLLTIIAVTETGSGISKIMRNKDMITTIQNL